MKNNKELRRAKKVTVEPEGQVALFLAVVGHNSNDCEV